MKRSKRRPLKTDRLQGTLDCYYTKRKKKEVSKHGPGQNVGKCSVCNKAVICKGCLLRHFTARQQEGKPRSRHLEQRRWGIARVFGSAPVAWELLWLETRGHRDGWACVGISWPRRRGDVALPPTAPSCCFCLLRGTRGFRPFPQ